VVEALGNPVRWRLTPGQRHDITQAQALVEGLTTQALTQAVVADKAFDADEFIESIKKTGAQAVIPPRDNRTQARDYDRHLYNAVTLSNASSTESNNSAASPPAMTSSTEVTSLSLTWFAPSCGCCK